MIAPSYNLNQRSYPLVGFSNLFKRGSGSSLAFSSRVKPSACEARMMANELVSSLRVLDKSIKATIDLAASDMAGGKIKSASKHAALYKRIRELMLSQLGAFEAPDCARASSTVYFIEPGEAAENGEAGDDTLYLCRSVCSKSDPLNTWTSERLLALSGHAISRAFVRRCAWASGYAVTAQSLVETLCSLHAACDKYVDEALPRAGKAGEFQRLSRLGWLVQCGVNDSQYIVDQQDVSMPCVKTVISSKADSLDDGELRMIPPKGRFGLPRLAINITELAAL